MENKWKKGHLDLCLSLIRSEWAFPFYPKWAIFQLSCQEISFWCDIDDILYVVFLDHHAELDFYCASPLKQPSTGRHVTPFRHIIMKHTTRVVFYSLMLCTSLNSSIYQFYSLWFDLYLRWIYSSLHQQGNCSLI